MDGKPNPINMAWHCEGFIDLGRAVVAFSKASLTVEMWHKLV